MNKSLSSAIMETAEFLRSAGVSDPDVGMVLGTGLNNYADGIEDPVIIPYSEIPNFHAGKVDSHRGQLVFGRRNGRKVIIMAGRYHYYESGDIKVDGDEIVKAKWFKKDEIIRYASDISISDWLIQKFIDSH